MTNDRFGIRWGLAGGTTLASIDEARNAARFAEEAGFDSFWISHAMAVDPIVALACLGSDFAGIGEVGTSVVPLYGRHPIGLAQLARTAQNALGGRFTLGVGTASKRHVEGMLGLSWGKPFSYTREFIAALEHVVGPQEQVAAVCIGPDDDMEQRRQDILDGIAAVEDGAGVVLLTDMFGGTPSNLAISVIDAGPHVEVIAGINLPMLIKLASVRSRCDLQAAVTAAQEAGRKYINVASALLTED